jgi:hypothetical protein
VSERRELFLLEQDGVTMFRFTEVQRLAVDIRKVGSSLLVYTNNANGPDDYHLVGTWAGEKTAHRIRQEIVCWVNAPASCGPGFIYQIPTDADIAAAKGEQP